MTKKTRLRFLIALLAVVCFVLSGCGEEPSRTDDDSGDDAPPADVDDQDAEDPGEEPGDDQGDVDEPDDEEPVDVSRAGSDIDFSFDLADPEVGQWISYGVDNEPVAATVSIVGADMADGESCLWYQFHIPGEVTFKLLANFEDLQVATEAMEEMWAKFAGDPEQFIRDAVAESGSDWASNMMMTEDALESGMAFLSGLKMLIIEENGVLMGYDISGVAEVLQPVMENPEMFGSMAGMSGLDMGAGGGSPQSFDADEILATLDDLEMGAGPVQWTVGGQSVNAIHWEMEYLPENTLIEVVISNELPILPLAYARVVDEGEEHWLEARDFGWSGAVDELPGDPVQVIDVAQMLEGFVQMAESGALSGMGPQ